MIREYVEEFGFYFALFFGFMLMYKGFVPLAKMVVAATPAPAGAKEAMAA